MIEYYNDGIPAPIYEAMLVDGYNPGKVKTFISGSQFSIGPKKYWGTRKVNGKKVTFKLPISSLYFSWIGTAIHNHIELGLKGKDNYKLEERIYADFEIGGETLVVSGQFDCLDLSTGTLWDWKTISVAKWKTKKFEEYIQQTNIYLYLLKHGYWVGKDGKKCPIKQGDIDTKIGFVFRDWAAMQVKTKDYPKKGMLAEPLERWEDEVTKKLIVDKLTALHKYKDTPLDEIPECSHEGRWQKPTTFPVFKTNKDGSKKAKETALPGTTKFSSLDEGVEFISKRKDKDILYIGYRLSTPVHCEQYCNVGKTGQCSWYEKFKRGEIDGEPV